jgi:hypothetical protein
MVHNVQVVTTVSTLSSLSGIASAEPSMNSTGPKPALLCVVDLRDIPEESLDTEWAVEDIEALAKITCDIGDRVKSTCRLVETAKKNSVGIRNESALRYEILLSIWESGMSISEWVKLIQEPT